MPRQKRSITETASPDHDTSSGDDFQPTPSKRRKLVTMPSKRRKLVNTRWTSRKPTTETAIYVSPRKPTSKPPRQKRRFFRRKTFDSSFEEDVAQQLDTLVAAAQGRIPFGDKYSSTKRQPALAANVEFSRKREISEILDSSADEHILIKGKPLQKKSKNALSESMEEAFCASSSDESSDTDACSEDDIFHSFVEDRHTNENVNVNSVCENVNKNAVKNASKESTDIGRTETNVTSEMVGVKTGKRYVYSLVDNGSNSSSSKATETDNTCNPNPQHSDQPVECVSEIDQLVSKAYLYPVKRIIDINGATSITLYTKEIITLCRTFQKHLHLGKTFNIGSYFVTMFVFRQKNLINKCSHKKMPPLMLGPTLLHFDKSVDTYEEFLSDIQQQTGILKVDFEGAHGNSMIGIPVMERPLVQAMRTVFGLNMTLCDRQHSVASFKRQIVEGFSCVKPVVSIMKAIENLETYLFNTQSKAMRLAFQGDRDTDYKLTHRAREHVALWYGQNDAYQKFLELGPE